MSTWPSWWDWDLELSPHLLKRMIERDFDELLASTDVVIGNETGTGRRSRSMGGANAVASADLGGDSGTGRRRTASRSDHRLSGQLMKEAYLEVTYRRGRAIAAYYYLPRRPRQKVASTRRAENGLIVDLAANG